MILIKNGYMLDPRSGKEGKFDILIDNDKIIQIEEFISSISLSEEQQDNLDVIYADHMMIAPGLVDVHVHFRDPGFAYKEDIYSGAKSAAKGGFTTVVMMANTKPTIDNLETLSYVLEKGKETEINVLTCGSITKGLQGNELTNMKELKEAGAVGFTDDGIPMLDESVVRNAMTMAKELNVPLSYHEENPALITNNGINRGKASEHFKIGGSPRAAEIDLIYRDLELAKEIEAAINIQHISSKEGVELVRQAKQAALAKYELQKNDHNDIVLNPTSVYVQNSNENPKITTEQSQKIHIHAEATPHHFSLNENAAIEFGTLAKMNPPLRTEEDRLAIIEGLKDNTIDIIATDHAPHSKEEKDKSITEAPSGIIGLETSLPLGITNLVKENHLSYMELIEKMTINPATMYHLDCGYIAEGGPADLVIFNEDDFIPSTYESKSTNTPFTNQKLNGCVQYTICKGKVVYSK